jgi:hypothetical protein
MQRRVPKMMKKAFPSDREGKAERVGGGPLAPLEAAMARRWFGYGRRKAPYWFIGIEPGGDELGACVRAWEDSGGVALLDLRTGHSGHSLDWFSERAGAQPTWAKLIWLLLAYKDQLPTVAATKRYQKEHLGRRDGETALLELSCLPAKHNGVRVPREQFLDSRVATMHRWMIGYAPRFVVFYCAATRYRDVWSKIAGRALNLEEPTMVGPTACVVVSHPNHNRSKAYWMGIGVSLRELIKSQRGLGELRGVLSE